MSLDPFFIGNVFGDTWNNTPNKTWATFTNEVQTIKDSNQSFENIIHTYTYPSSIQCTVSVEGTHNNTQNDVLLHIPTSGTQEFYVQSGKQISYELIFPGTIINLETNAYTHTLTGVGGTCVLDSNEITLHNAINNLIEKHIITFKITAPSEEGSVDVGLAVKNVCRKPFSPPLFRFIVDNTPPQPSSVRMLHQYYDGSSWITNETYTHDTYITGWSGSIGNERIVWELTFDEPLINANNSEHLPVFQLKKGSASTLLTTSTNVVYSEDTTPTIQVNLPRDSDTESIFDNMEGLNTGAELSVALHPVFDRAGNSYTYDSKSTSGTNPTCVLRVKTSIPEMTTYDIVAVDESLDFWNTATILSGTELDITVSFNCEVDVQSLVWKNMNDNVVNLSLQSNTSVFALSATWRYTVPDSTNDVRFTISNVKDRAGNSMPSTVIPRNMFDKPNILFSSNNDYSTPIIYSKVGDVITLQIFTTFTTYKPIVRIAEQVISSENIVSTSISNTNWTATYTIPTPSNEIPAQGTASVFILIENYWGKDKHTTAHNVLHIDTIQPVLSAVSIRSSNNEDDPLSHRFARLGDTVTLTIQTNETIQSPTGTWFTDTADEVSMNSTWSQDDANSPSQWSTNLVVTETMPQGPMTFIINYTDLSGNSGLDKNSQSVISEADLEENVTIDTKEPIVVYYAKLLESPQFTQRIQNGNSVSFPLGYLGPLSMTFGPDMQWQNITILENGSFLTTNNNVTWTLIETSDMIYYEWSSPSSSYSSYDDYKLIFFRDGTVDFVQTLDVFQSTGASDYNGPPTWNGSSSANEVRRIQFDQELRAHNAIQTEDVTIPTLLSSTSITFSGDIPHIPTQALVQDTSYNWNKDTWDSYSSVITLSDHFSSSQPIDVFFNGSLEVDSSMEIHGTCTISGEIAIDAPQSLNLIGSGRLVLLTSNFDTSNTLTLNY